MTGKKNFSHNGDPMTPSSLGNSRKWGDANEAVQFAVQKEIVQQAAQANLSQRDTANLLSLAEVESGFNPDAATPQHQSSASGVFAITDTTAADVADRLSGSKRIGGYSVDGPYKRFDTASNISYGIAVYLDKKKVADSPDVGEIYKAWNTNPAEYNKLLGRLEKNATIYQKDLDNKLWDGPGPAAPAKAATPAPASLAVKPGGETSKSVSDILSSLANPQTPSLDTPLGVLKGNDTPSNRLLSPIPEPVKKDTVKPSLP